MYIYIYIYRERERVIGNRYRLHMELIKGNKSKSTYLNLFRGTLIEVSKQEVSAGKLRERRGIYRGERERLVSLGEQAAV